MNVDQIQMSKEEAQIAFDNYRMAVKERHDIEDEKIMRGYKEILKGNTLISLSAAFAKAGLKENGLPNLAIAQANAKKVLLSQSNDRCHFAYNKGIDKTYSLRYINWNATRNITSVSIPGAKRKPDYYESPVPNTPPQFRPARGFHNLYILWEVEHWGRVPRDPMLLKKIGGDLYSVLAVWDLTPIEMLVLEETRSVN